jgi:hypothetical protein
MKPVLIQTLHRLNEKRRETTSLAPSAQVTDALYKGRRDRSGFIVGLCLFITIAVALALS